jgi:hypothetical protein
MNLVIDASSRQAALLLRSLGDLDREWVLSSLSAAEQATLRGLLQELKDLGIPEDGGSFPAMTSPGGGVGGRNDAAETYGAAASIVRHGTSAPDAGADTLRQSGDAGAPDSRTPRSEAHENIVKLERLTPRELDILAQLLNKESAGLVARLLAMHDWAWRDALLARMSAIQRRRVEDLGALRRKGPARSEESVAPSIGLQGDDDAQSSHALNAAMARTLLEAISEMAVKIPIESVGNGQEARSVHADWRRKARDLVHRVISPRRRLR